MKTHPSNRTVRPAAGFTLPEVMMAVFLFGGIMAAALSLYVTYQREWADVSVDMDATIDASLLLARIVHGPGQNIGIRAAEANSVTYSTNAAGSVVQYQTSNGVTSQFIYDRNSRRVLYSNNSMAPNTVPIGRAVEDFTVSHATNGLYVAVTVRESANRSTATKSMSTFVLFRN